VHRKVRGVFFLIGQGVPSVAISNRKGELIAPVDMPAVCKLRNLVTGVPHLILPGVHLVGRSEEADILLADQSISRRHARIYNTEEGLMVEDLGSSNGTYVQGRKIEGRVRISLGEEVRLGAVTFRIDPEVGEASGRGEQLAGPVKVAPEQMRRRTHKITAEELDMAKAKRVTARQAPAAPVTVAGEGGKYPGSSLFQAAPAPQVGPAPVPTPAASPIPWFAGGLVVGVLLGVAVGWWLARF
jgi:predicted component of type VI protein secretion system